MISFPQFLLDTERNDSEAKKKAGSVKRRKPAPLICPGIGSSQPEVIHNKAVALDHIIFYFLHLELRKIIDMDKSVDKSPVHINQ